MNIGTLTATLGADLRQLRTSMDRAEQTVKNYDRVVGRELGQAGGRFKKFANVATASLQRVKKRVFSMKGMFVGLGVGLAGRAFIKFGATFERTMSIVRVVSGATRKEMMAFRKETKRLGESTEFTATQAGLALRFLAMAGLTVMQSMKALPIMLDLATSGQIDLARAADISTNIMTQMGLRVEELTKVNDALVAVQASANTNIEEAAQAFIFAGTKARDFGVNVFELNALIGLLANAGIKGSMAGTTLRQSMIKLMRPVGDATEVMRKYEIRIEKVGGGLRNYVEILKDMADKNLSAIEITKLFGARAGNVAAILRLGSGAIQEFVDKLKSMEGIAKSAAEIIRKDVQGSIDELKSILQGVVLDAWDKYKLKIQSTIKAITGFIRTHKTDILGIIGAMTTSTKDMLLLLVFGAASVIDVMAPLIANAWGMMKQMWDGFRKLPPWVQQIGLMGAILGGVKGAIVVGALAHIYQALSQSMLGFQQVMKGNISMAEFATMNYKELKTTLKQLVDDGVIPAEEGLVGLGSVELKTQPGAATAWVDSWITAINKGVAQINRETADAEKRLKPLIPPWEGITPPQGVDPEEVMKIKALTDRISLIQFENTLLGETAAAIEALTFLRSIDIHEGDALFEKYFQQIQRTKSEFLDAKQALDLSEEVEQQLKVITASLGTQEERIRESYERRVAIVNSATLSETESYRLVMELHKQMTEQIAATQKSFNDDYTTMNMDKWEVEKFQLDQQFENYKKFVTDKKKLDEWYAAKTKQLEMRTFRERLSVLGNVADMMSDNFRNIAEMGGKFSKEAFLLQKGFAIVGTVIRTIEGAHAAYTGTLKFLTPLIGPAAIPAAIAAAAVVTAFGVAQVAAIAASQPPSFDLGGVSVGKGIFQTGNIAEAHIPLQSGRVPVELGRVGDEEGGLGTTEINVTIIAADARSITEMMKRNPEAIIGPFIEQLQGGNQELRSAIKRTA